MAAPQDTWARPLAKSLVDAFRVPSLSYIRVSTAYNTTTGLTTDTETTYTGAGALIKSSNNEETGELGGNESIDPKYSGDTKYACKVVAYAA